MTDYDEDDDLSPEDDEQSPDEKLSPEELYQQLMEKAIELSDAFEQLDYGLMTFKDYLLSQTLPYFIPPHYGIQDPRQFVANQQTEVWYHPHGRSEPKALSKSGIYCVDDQVLSIVSDLNERKLVFKASIFKIREEQGLRYSIDAHLRTRSAAFNAALRRNHLGMLDLNACYRPIQVVTDPVQSFMFCWARSHKRVLPTRVSDVRLQLEQMPDPVGLDAVAHLRHDDWLADVRPVSKVGRPNLTANLVYESRQDPEANLKATIRCAHTILYRHDQLPDKFSFENKKMGDDLGPTRTRRKTKIGDPISPNSQFHFYM